MSQLVMVRYEVKPDLVCDNEILARAVFDEFAATQPAGLSYATFVLDDGVSFVHLARTDNDEGHFAHSDSPAFARFKEGLGHRAVTPPVRSVLRQVGSYRVFGG